MVVRLDTVVMMGRRIGVRAQFGDALRTMLPLLGRIGIRPQICYRCHPIELRWTSLQPRFSFVLITLFFKNCFLSYL